MNRRSLLRMLGLAPVGLPLAVASSGSTLAVATIESELARHGQPPEVVMAAHREFLEVITTVAVDVQRDGLVLGYPLDAIVAAVRAKPAGIAAHGLLAPRTCTCTREARK